MLKTCALRGEGIEELLTAANAHWQYQHDNSLHLRRERERVTEEIRRILRATLLERLLERIPEDTVSDIVEQVAARHLDPYAAAEALINRVSPQC